MPFFPERKKPEAIHYHVLEMPFTSLMSIVLLCLYLIPVYISNSAKCKAAFPHQAEYIVLPYSHEIFKEIKRFVEISYSVSL